MTTKHVWYFCEREAHPQRGWHPVKELVCYRMMEGDPRISEWTRGWQKKGYIFDYLWLPDPATEMAYLSAKCRYERVGRITVKDSPTEGSKLTS